jgi:hypothetical protein
MVMAKKKTTKTTKRITRKSNKKSITSKKKIKKVQKTTRSAKKTTRAKKKPARTTKKTKTKNSFKDLTIINEKLSLLESQALKAYECVQAIRKRSTPDWKDWVSKLSPQDWSALAGAQRERISLEVKHLSDEILSKIYGADVLSNKNGVLQEAKDSLEDIINKIDDSALVEKAIDTAIHTKDGLLAFLNIPTHEEMVHLQRQLKRLERRMSQLAGGTTRH